MDLHASGGSLGGPFGLGALHVMLDRTLIDTLPLNWVIAFETSAGLNDAVQYGVYVDIDHADKSGATVDPLGKPITVDPLALPEYVIYVNKTSGQTPNPINATYFRWTGTAWLPSKTLSELGGDLWYDAGTQALQLLVPTPCWAPRLLVETASLIRAHILSTNPRNATPKKAVGFNYQGSLYL